MPEFAINQRDIKRLNKWGRRISDPKITFKALRSGIGAATTVLAKETRRVLASYGFRKGNSTLAANITTKTSSSRKKQQVNSRVGARNRKVNGQNPAKYFHLLDGGTRPHWQPNAWRPVTVNGISRLVKIEGGAQHPGSKAKPIREPAQRKAAPKAQKKFKEKFRQVVFRELEKATKEAQR